MARSFAVRLVGVVRSHWRQKRHRGRPSPPLRYSGGTGYTADQFELRDSLDRGPKCFLVTEPTMRPSRVGRRFQPSPSETRLSRLDAAFIADEKRRGEAREDVAGGLNAGCHCQEDEGRYYHPVYPGPYSIAFTCRRGWDAELAGQLIMY